VKNCFFPKTLRRIPSTFALALFTLGLVAAASAQSGSYSVITEFNGTNGRQPIGNLIADSIGNLYGVTEYGGNSNCANGCGTVFQLKKSSGAWQFSELFQFTGGSDGATPLAGLTIDSSGNLYGTAFYGGANSQGVAYKLSPGTKGVWTQTVLWAFQGGANNDGGYPASQMAFDSSGNLYGTTEVGGTGGCGFGNSCGVVFILSAGSSGEWTESVIYNFNNPNDTYGPNGWEPSGPVVFDSHGNLFGTTSLGGSLDTFCGIYLYGCGVVFELSPGSSGWTESVAYTFNGATNGGYAQSGVTIDSAGNLYGTTVEGGEGCVSGYNPCAGTIFILQPNTSGGYNGHTLFTFEGNYNEVGPTGGLPLGSLTLDSAGSIYGSASSGGRALNGRPGDGTVYKLSRSPGSVKQTLLHTFQPIGAGGSGPSSNILIDSAGNLYGTATRGGSSGNGVVFEIRP
jgi:uncharacterized repeat protein (TIGR03803 family)